MQREYQDFDLYEIPHKESCVFLSIWNNEETQIILESNGSDILELDPETILEQRLE